MNHRIKSLCASSPMLAVMGLMIWLSHTFNITASDISMNVAR